MIIVQLVKAGGSLAFNVKKIIKRERLNWKEGDVFMVDTVNDDEITLTRLKTKLKKKIKETDEEKPLFNTDAVPNASFNAK